MPEQDEKGQTIRPVVPADWVEIDCAKEFGWHFMSGKPTIPSLWQVSYEPKSDAIAPPRPVRN